MHYCALFVSFPYFLLCLVTKSRIVKESTNPYYLLTISQLLFNFSQLFIDYLSLLIDHNFLALLSTIFNYLWLFWFVFGHMMQGIRQSISNTKRVKKRLNECVALNDLK